MDAIYNVGLFGTRTIFGVKASAPILTVVLSAVNDKRLVLVLTD
jgi:hypothetical protein